MLQALRRGSGFLRAVATEFNAASVTACLHAQVHSSAQHAAGNDIEARPLQRFFRTANIAPDPQGGYQVMLDKRALKSPAGHPLILPSQLMALAVAAEWEQQPKPRERVIDTLLQYLHTDSACCREEPGPVADRQAQVFDPILRWAEGELQAELVAGSDLLGMQQSEQLVDAAHGYLQGLDQWHLAAVEAAASACRSVILGLALVKGRLTVAETLAAARLEEDQQIEQWGLVEGGHDIDIADAAARVSAAALFARFNR